MLSFMVLLEGRYFPQLLGLMMQEDFFATAHPNSQPQNANG
jgi:hypothetical protein